MEKQERERERTQVEISMLDINYTPEYTSLEKETPLQPIYFGVPS